MNAHPDIRSRAGDLRAVLAAAGQEPVLILAEALALHLSGMGCTKVWGRDGIEPGLEHVARAIAAVWRCDRHQTHWEARRRMGRAVDEIADDLGIYIPAKPFKHTEG